MHRNFQCKQCFYQSTSRNLFLSNSVPIKAGATTLVLILFQIVLTKAAVNQKIGTLHFYLCAIAVPCIIKLILNKRYDISAWANRSANYPNLLAHVNKAHIFRRYLPAVAKFTGVTVSAI